jgi:hypothetical protein
MKIRYFILFFFFLSYAEAQVGIGTNTPNASAMLDIESPDKGVLIPRIALINTTDNTTITNGNVLGLVVFNTATRNDVSPGFYYWNGTQWLKFITTASGSSIVGAANGLGVSGSDVVLGGSLNAATTITTTNTNTLSLQGLQNGNPATDQLVSINPITGVLTKTSGTTLVEQSEVVYMATNGQVQFDTPTAYSSLSKLAVYRNGVKVGLTAVDPDTIQLESGVVCNTNDEIRVVQLN